MARTMPGLEGLNDHHAAAAVRAGMVALLVLLLRRSESTRENPGTVPCVRSLRLRARPSLVRFRCKPSLEGRAHGGTGHQMIAPTSIYRAHDQHPAHAEGILIQELRPALELWVGGNYGTGERSPRCAYPFA